MVCKFFIIRLDTSHISGENIILLLKVHHISRIFRSEIKKVQSTLVTSKSKGPTETLQDIRTSTYQMCRIEENTKQKTNVHK